MTSMRFVRHISISQSPIVASLKQPVGSSASIAASSGITSLSKKEDTSSEVVRLEADDVTFKVLNKASTVLSVSSPPSLPVHIKRGSLLSIYGVESSPGSGSALASIRSSLDLLSPLKAILYGGRSFQYQSLISTKPYSLLVSSIASSYWFQKPSNKTFATLELDGTSDWAVFPKDALQAYSGSALSISLHRLPTYISRKLASATNSPKTTPTGLFRWTNSGFTLLTGRGNAGLVASGSIYSVQIEEGEEILINHKNLVAITTNGPYDLQNCILKYSIQLAEVPQAVAVAGAPPSVVATKTSVASIMQSIKSFWRSVTLFTRRQRHTLYNQLVGNKDYVKVVGPRTLLLQTSNSNVRSYEPIQSERISQSEKLIASQNSYEEERSSSDYLNYVTITPKGAVFESTPDFQESVNKLKGADKSK